MNATQRETEGAAVRGKAAAPDAADWLRLAAAPTFAIVALLTGVVGGGPSDMPCSTMQGASLLNGMAPMYLLMSAFHSAPWLTLISSRLKRDELKFDQECPPTPLVPSDEGTQFLPHNERHGGSPFFFLAGFPLSRE